MYRINIWYELQDQFICDMFLVFDSIFRESFIMFWFLVYSVMISLLVYIYVYFCVYLSIVWFYCGCILFCVCCYIFIIFLICFQLNLYLVI